MPTSAASPPRKPTMRRRRTLLSLLALTVAVVLTLSRCDRRQPGEAAAPTPEQRLADGTVRRDLRFPCGDATCAGWLYLPPDGPGTPGTPGTLDRPRTTPPPVVVIAHGFAGTRDVGLAPIAERLAAAGIAAFVFDYRHFGASGGLPRQIVDPESQLEDWRAALRFVRALPEVDGTRSALFGSSMGGGHALIVAADDPELRAVVAQAPLVDSGMEGEATYFGAGWAARILLSGWADMALSSIGRDPILLPAIAPSGGFGMIVDDTAYGAFEKLIPADASETTYRNAVAARSVFLFDDYDPAQHTAQIKAPVLLIASRTDRFAPWAAIEAYDARASNVEVATFDGDHFDVYSPPASTQAADAATAFLARHLR